MGKYTKSQLKEMATETMNALNSGDVRAGILIMQLSIATRLPQNVVHQKIQELANLTVEGETNGNSNS